MAARGAAGNVLPVDGIAGGSVDRVFRGGAHGELVHVAAAHGNGPGIKQPLDDSGVVGSYIALQNAAGAGELVALDGYIVLYGKGNTQEGLVLQKLFQGGLPFCRCLGTELVRLLSPEDGIVVDFKEGVQGQLGLGISIKDSPCLLHQLLAGDDTCGKGIPHPLDGLHVEIGHDYAPSPSTLGTRK